MITLGHKGVNVRPAGVVWYALIALGCSALIGAALSLFPRHVVAIFVGSVGLVFSVVLILKPTWLYYAFMLLFVFGEVGAGAYVVQPSLSNVFALLGLAAVIVYGLFGKRLHTMLKRREQRDLLLPLLGILLIETLSALFNNSFRPLATRMSHLITFLFVVLIVQDVAVLWFGLYFGITSVGILGALTILATLGLNPYGTRAPGSWGSTPWEDTFHRSIGLPNMDGGLHSIYILAFLPLAVLLVVNGRRLRVGYRVRALSLLAAVLGLLALLIASYRSGWLGLGMSMLCLVWLNGRTLDPRQRGGLIAAGVAAGVLLLFAGFGKPLYDYSYNLIFGIRGQGVDARLIQYQFVLNKMLTPTPHLIIGFGYEDFAVSFMKYAALQGFRNPEIYPWVHDYYLGLLYASGWAGFLFFLLYVYRVFRNLYRQCLSPNPRLQAMSAAIFASLAGMLTVLLFTAEVSGLHIIWLLIGASVFAQKAKTQCVLSSRARCGR